MSAFGVSPAQGAEPTFGPGRLALQLADALLQVANPGVATPGYPQGHGAQETPEDEEEKREAHDPRSLHQRCSECDTEFWTRTGILRCRCSGCDSDFWTCTGLRACDAEWKLICTTHNLLKLWRHSGT